MLSTAMHDYLRFGSSYLLRRPLEPKYTTRFDFAAEHSVVLVDLRLFYLLVDYIHHPRDSALAALSPCWRRSLSDVSACLPCFSWWRHATFCFQMLHRSGRYFWRAQKKVHICYVPFLVIWYQWDHPVKSAPLDIRISCIVAEANKLDKAELTLDLLSNIPFGQRRFFHCSAEPVLSVVVAQKRSNEKQCDNKPWNKFCLLILQLRKQCKILKRLSLLHRVASMCIIWKSLKFCVEVNFSNCSSVTLVFD